MAAKPDTRPPLRPDADGVIRLAGGNPQIAKGYGEAPVAAYIAAMPGWKSPMGRRLDALIAATVPGVSKAVKWNAPFYGVEQGRWFLSFSCLTRYIKFAFLDGAALDPPPPVLSAKPKIRYLHIFEAEPFDEAQFVRWVDQAARLPGERM